MNNKPIDLKEAWNKFLKRQNKKKSEAVEMPKPKSILKVEDKNDGYFYICPYCGRYVMRTSGLQQCLICGGMVDNDNAQLVPRPNRVKFDGKISWR